MARHAAVAPGPASSHCRCLPREPAGLAAAAPWRCDSQPGGRQGPGWGRWWGSDTTWQARYSEFGRSGRSWVGDGVADVGQSADIDQQALEAEAEAGVRHRAVAAQVTVPVIGGRIEPELDHSPVEVVQSLLALRTADDLADARREHVHRGHGFFVIVQAHVE